MSALRPWRVHCARQYVGSFGILADAKGAADNHSSHWAIRASAVNTVTGERWFRGRAGWRQTALPEMREAVRPFMPHEVDR